MMESLEKRGAAPDPRTLHGIGVSPGIVIGRVLPIDAGRCRKQVAIAQSDAASEKRRFQDAVSRAGRQLAAVRQQFAEHLEEYVSIVDSHLLMLRDRMLYNRTLEIIESEGVNAEWALEKALQRTRARFERIDDRYLRERFRDVEQVADRVFRILGGLEEDLLSEPGEKVIVVARDFSPEDTMAMRSDRILGFVTETGGVTSHTAIVARSLGIPSVVAVEDILRQVTPGDTIILDGATGRIHLHPTGEQLRQYGEYQRQCESYSRKVALYAHLPAETLDGLRINVYANIEMPEEVGVALEYGAGGIGLYRSEYYYVSQKQAPDEESLFCMYREMLTVAAPFPVTIRTFDVGGDKFASVVSSAGERNPALGLRAIRFSLRERSIFAVQLRALLRASVYGNLRIMFPMISSVCEVLKVKEIMANLRRELAREGMPYSDAVQVGIMIEVPSAASVADVLAAEVDFFSIGTNDLIQYVLAIDRTNEYVAHMYDPLHPAVLRMIKQVVDAGHEAGIEVGLCGEMAGDVSYLPLLLGLGLDELSMNPLAVPYIKRMIRSSTAEEVENIAQDILRRTSAQDIHQYLSGYLPQRYPEEFGEEGLHRLKQSCCSAVLSECCRAQETDGESRG